MHGEDDGLTCADGLTRGKPFVPPPPLVQSSQKQHPLRGPFVQNEDYEHERIILPIRIESESQTFAAHAHVMYDVHGVHDDEDMRGVLVLPLRHGHRGRRSVAPQSSLPLPRRDRGDAAHGRGRAECHPGQVPAGSRPQVPAPTSRTQENPALKAENPLEMMGSPATRTPRRGRPRRRLRTGDRLRGPSLRRPLGFVRGRSHSREQGRNGLRESISCARGRPGEGDPLRGRP